MKTLICNAQLVNEGTIRTQDLLIDNGRISQIASQITAPAGAQVIDAQGKHLLPGMIDDQVHFREPGFPNKGTIASESRAAVAGGITSFMEMPNVNPQTTNLQALEDKYTRASQSSLANFAFYLGATNDNLEEIKRLDPNQACGVKIFMGASTGNMLVDNSATLDGIFANSPVVIATHCEDSPTIAANEAAMREKYGDAIPMELHGEIRSREACLKSSQLATELAIRHKARLHVLHLTTADELYLFEPAKQLAQLKGANITAEVCVHHLSFNDSDYARLGSQIKCNPAIKTLADQQALIDAVNRDIIDIIATDHAPHTWKRSKPTAISRRRPVCRWCNMHCSACWICMPRGTSVWKKSSKRPAMRWPSALNSKTGAICAKAIWRIWYWWISTSLSRPRWKTPAITAVGRPLPATSLPPLSVVPGSMVTNCLTAVALSTIPWANASHLVALNRT